MTELEKSRGISRRTIARTAAWSVPAVAVVAATPAYAVSAHWDAAISRQCSSGLLTSTSRVGFTVTNVGTATMPTGTQFNLVIGGLVSLDLFTHSGDLINLNVIGAVQLGMTTVYTFQTVSDVPPGGTATLTLPSSLLNVKLLTNYTLSVLTTEPAGASSANNSASFNYTNVSLGTLDVIAACS